MDPSPLHDDSPVPEIESVSLPLIPAPAMHILHILHTLRILHIKHIIHIVYYSISRVTFFLLCRRQILKERASRITRSVCETFAFATSETVSIESGNRLIQAVGNDGFNPEDISFNTLPTMSNAVIKAMLPG